MHAIATQGLTKVYKSLAKAKKPSLDHLDLEVAREECFGFLGRNGAGKTTTIKLLCSLIHPTSGTALIFGESVQARATRRLIGYLPEQPYFYEYLTPRETVDFYGRVRGLLSSNPVPSTNRTRPTSCAIEPPTSARTARAILAKNTRPTVIFCAPATSRITSQQQTDNDLCRKSTG